MDRLAGWEGAAALGGSLTRLRVLPLGPEDAAPALDLRGLAHLGRLRELDVDLRMHARLRQPCPARSPGVPLCLRPLLLLRQLRQVAPLLIRLCNQYA